MSQALKVALTLVMIGFLLILMVDRVLLGHHCDMHHRHANSGVDNGCGHACGPALEVCPEPKLGLDTDTAWSTVKTLSNL